jgi:hypothetical protein
VRAAVRNMLRANSLAARRQNRNMTAIATAPFDPS